MSKDVKIRKGVNIKLKGVAERLYADAASTSDVVIKPTDFPGLIPKLSVKVGDKVKAGSPLFYNKENDRITWSKNAVEDRGFVNSVQWEELDEKDLTALGKPALPMNIVKPGVEQVVSQLASESPRFTGTAVENSDAEMAGYEADLMSHIWTA